MEATKHDILDLVITTVGYLCENHVPHKLTPVVQISGDNILIGSTPVSIASIRVNSGTIKRFLALIQEAL